MVERLTEHKTTKGITRVVVRDCVCEFQTVLNKLCAFEDIMEKYGIDVEELDDFFANYKVSDFLTEERIKEIAINEQRKVLQSMIKEITEKECNQLYTELNTWKMACELACDAMTKLGGDDCCGCRLDKKMCDICENKKALFDYFYQQAKTEGNDE